MPLYSDHYYYGSGQPPAYYLPSSTYTPTTSRISSPYSFSYMSPISAMLSAGIGTNPLPRGLRSYSPMLSSISEAGSPLMSRRDIGNHRSSPRRLGGKNYYRQRPVVIDTDSLDLSKRKKEDNEEVESTPGMISRAKTIVRMHTRKLKENPELKKKKTQAEILMEKYFIKEKPIQEEEIPRRKRIWEEREEELNNTLIRGGTIKRLNTVNKRPSNSVPVEEVDIPEKLDEIIPVRKMSIDSELFKEEEALLDCMIQEELGLGNLKEMKGGTQEDEMDPDRSNTIKRKSKIKKDQMSYGRRKSSLDIVLDESGALVGKRKSHVRKKKTSKPLPLDEVNMSEGHSGSDSSSKDIKDDTKMNKRRSTKKKKPPKFKIDSLHVEEKSSPKVLRKFQYEVIVEDGKNSDKSSGKLKSVTHINIENIPKDGQHKLLKEESRVKSDVFIKTNIDEKADVAGIVLPSNICDSKCDTLTNSLIRKNDTLTNKNSCMEEVSNFDCKNEIDHIEKKTEKLFNNVAVKGLLDRSLNNEPDSSYRLELKHVNKHKTEATEIESLESQIDQKDSQKKLIDVKLLSNQDTKIRALPDKNKQHKSPLLPVKTAGNKTKQESFNASFNQICGKNDLPSVSTDNFATNIKDPVLKDCNPAFTLEKSRSDDKKKTIQTTGKLEEQVTTMKQKSLTPDLSRKITSNLTHKSEPTTPIMYKKQVLPKSNLNKNQTDADQLLTKSVLKTKSNETQEGSSSDTIKLVSTNLEKQSKTNEIQPLNVFFGDKEIKPKPSLVKTEAEIKAKKEPKELTADVTNTDTKKVDTQKARKTEEKQIDEIGKNKNPPIKVAPDVINKDLFISNKKEEASPFHLKKLQDGIFTQKASKDKIVQLNIENAETRLGKGEENNRTGLLTKDNQIAVKFTDNLNGLQKILPPEKAPSNPQLKEEVLKKELDCNSNQISEISFVNKLVAMNKGGIPPQKKVNVMDDNVGIAIKIEQNKEEEKEVKSKNLKYVIDKNKKVENINGKDNTNKVLSKHALESAKPDLTSEVPLKNHQLKEDIIKKPGGNIFKSTDIPAEKSLKTKNEKDCDETQAAAVREKRHMNKDKIIPSKGDEKPSQGRDMFSKENPTILKIVKTNPPKAEVAKNVKKEDNNKFENIKVIDNAEILSTPLVSVKVEETNKTIGDTVKSCLDDKREFHCNLGDKKTMVNEVKKSESKLTDNLLKQPKETIRGDKIKQSETKPTNIPSKQPNLAATISKTQEKMNDGTKVKGNELGASFSDRLDQKPKANSKETELSNKDQVQKKVNDSKDVVKKVTLDKEKTIQVSNEKKKRIKSESDVLDDECSGISGKAEISSKETDNKINEKSQSLKETTTENSSKKKKRSKDKGSSKKKINTKSPRKTKESPKTDKIKDKLKNTALLESHMKTTSSTTETVMTTTVNTTTTIKSEETEHSSRELSKRSTRLLHFINKCMRLSEDDGTIVIDYSDEEDSSSSSSSEYSSDSEYTSDSEEDTLTEDSSDECDVNCHRKCEKLMPNLCGVNQKLIVEALSSLRKGSSESRDHGSPTRRHSNAALSLDDESSRTGSGGTGAGRVTPPATTIPKFRKYTMDDFQFLKVLGKGSFGKVLLAELRGTQYYYAVKCLKKDVVLEDDDVECTLIERKVLALGTNHPYLCHLFCTFQTESHLFFVMEYLNGGDLMFHIQQQGRFDEGRARFYAAEIISGLKFLHKKGIVYRDLKLDNILLDFDGHVRIADFGMCKLQIYLDRTADTFCGTPDYMAPEIIKGLKYNQCVDWWSFGILMYEMLVGQSPFSGCDEDDLFWCICNRQPHYPRFITLEAKRILMQLLEKEASKRLGSSENGAIEVMAHPFFNGLDWDRLERRELMPPFKPNVKHPLDVHYFDKHFTAERACLTPIDPSILQSMDQTQFQGFSYTNPNVTD